MVCAQVLMLRSSGAAAAAAVIQLVGSCSAIPYAVAVDDLFLLDLWAGEAWAWAWTCD